MDGHAKFILTGRDNNSDEENLSFLGDAKVLISCRWGAKATLHEGPKPYLTVSFDKYTIGMRRFLSGVGDLQWLLHIQKVPEGAKEEDMLKFLLLQQKYNVQPIPASDPDEDQTSSGYNPKASSYPMKRKRN